MKPIEIHRRMKVQYGDACLSLRQVYEWTGKFMNGVSSVTDCPRPGHAHPVVTPEGIAAVEAFREEKSPRNSEWNGRTSGYESWISTPHRPWGRRWRKHKSFDSPSYFWSFQLIVRYEILQRPFTLTSLINSVIEWVTFPAFKHRRSSSVIVSDHTKIVFTR